MMMPRLGKKNLSKLHFQLTLELFLGIILGIKSSLFHTKFNLKGRQDITILKLKKLEKVEQETTGFG